MLPTSPRPGFTLPVFACAAAIAALQYLRHPKTISTVSVHLIEPSQIVEIEIEQVATIKTGTALAITRSDPGDNLDLTRNTPVWAVVEWGDVDQTDPIVILAGEGIGLQQAEGQPAIYRYARRLLLENLTPLLHPQETIRVTLILPEGKELALRTSNAAFGVVEGLSLLGTSGIAQPLSAPGQLEEFRQELQQKAAQFSCLVFCVGENGLNLAQCLGISVNRLVKTANWLGPLLVEAGIQKVESILLFGYHGKLIKLAGGIFHTHHHVADGRVEILAAHAAKVGLPIAQVQQLFTSQMAEDGLNTLRELDIAHGTDWVQQVYGSIVHAIDQRSQHYIYSHSGQQVKIGTMLFDRQRKIVVSSKNATTLLEQQLLV